ncbi:hypothetical protein PG911_09530 [Tenacibaculum ovolyticum]|uniref:hypothetical protein n=1 Tax=Tenacibaculum ovolyticum TaxID=104270 RepID=UPI0022F3E5E2|nr:hypothetical protein [Tenacibaculum ovolyticum]WBX74898.1 hypothetical protein PG911_09530 [Tenacibaculum ovolyticum]
MKACKLLNDKGYLYIIDKHNEITYAVALIILLLTEKSLCNSIFYIFVKHWS